MVLSFLLFFVVRQIDNHHRDFIGKPFFGFLEEGFVWVIWSTLFFMGSCIFLILSVVSLWKVLLYSMFLLKSYGKRYYNQFLVSFPFFGFIFLNLCTSRTISYFFLISVRISLNPLDYIIIATQMDYLHYLISDYIGWERKGGGGLANKTFTTFPKQSFID